MFAYDLARVALAGLLVIAVTCDLNTRRIPNTLVIVGIIGGLLMRCLIPLSVGIEWDPILSRVVPQSLFGILTGFCCLFPLYLVRAMGAGDVKLMAAVGAFLGPWVTLGAVLLTLLTGGVLSLIAAIGSGRLRQVFGNIKLIAFLSLTPGGHGVSVAEIATTGRLPYALAIAIGTAIEVWLTDWPNGL